MEDQIKEPLEGQGKIIQIDEEQVKRRLDNLVRGTVEETINELLEAEADQAGYTSGVTGPILQRVLSAFCRRSSVKRLTV